MALTDPQDTLAFHQSRMLTTHRDMSHVPCAQVAAQVKKFRDNDPKPETLPESEALWFYGMNHLVSLISADKAPLQPLDEFERRVVELYYEQMAEKAVRAFAYLLLICTREARHNKSLYNDTPTIKHKFGSPLASFFNDIKGGEPGIHSKLMSSPPKATIGEYVECLRWQFYHSKWNSGYGGAAWGQVTDCLARFVKGEFTAEMMLDTVWTLSHNNGPIFNKPHLGYAHYDMMNLLRILDVQRSGQVPEAILHDTKVRHYADAELIKIVLEASKRYTGRIGSYVDWEMVEMLGAVGHYHDDKQKQFEKYGMSPAAKEAAEKAAAAAKAKLEAEIKAKEEFEKTHFVIMPNTYVKKVQMDRAA